MQRLQQRQRLLPPRWQVANCMQVAACAQIWAALWPARWSRPSAGGVVAARAAAPRLSSPSRRRAEASEEGGPAPPTAPSVSASPLPCCKRDTVHGGSFDGEVLHQRWVASGKKEWPNLAKAPSTAFEDFRTDQNAVELDCPFIRRATA